MGEIQCRICFKILQRKKKREKETKRKSEGSKRSKNDRMLLIVCAGDGHRRFSVWFSLLKFYRVALTHLFNPMLSFTFLAEDVSLPDITF